MKVNVTYTPRPHTYQYIYDTSAVWTYYYWFTEHTTQHRSVRHNKTHVALHSATHKTTLLIHQRSVLKTAPDSIELENVAHPCNRPESQTRVYTYPQSHTIELNYNKLLGLLQRRCAYYCYFSYFVFSITITYGAQFKLCVLYLIIAISYLWGNRYRIYRIDDLVLIVVMYLALAIFIHIVWFTVLFRDV